MERFPLACNGFEAGHLSLVSEVVWLAVAVKMAGNGIANCRVLRLTAKPGRESDRMKIVPGGQ